MALMLYLDDALKILLQNDFIKDGYIDDDGGSEIVRNELEQKCYLREPVNIIRCKDCKHRPKEPDFETYESGFDLEFPEGSKCPCRCRGDEWYSWYPEDDWFCAEGERK